MVMRDRTKRMFANALIELAKTKSIRDIQVKALCESCGADRTTFYYHFLDKYDLVAWIFTKMYADECGKAERVNDEKMLRQMFARLWEQRAFFINALQDHSQNNLGQYLLDFYISSEQQAICRRFGEDAWDEETAYIVKQYSFGCLLHTIEWLLGETGLSPEKMAYYQFRCMPEILKTALFG